MKGSEFRVGLATVVTAWVLGVSHAPAHAGTNDFVVPTFRGTANSETGYWESFQVPYGAPGNLADKPGATSGAVLTQAETNAIVTGSGNIYNQPALSSFTLADTTPFPLATVVVQIRTVGSELDYPSVQLLYRDSNGTHALAPSFRYELNRATVPGQGTSVSSLWQWNLTGLGCTNYTIAFSAAGPSLSFDSLTLDTADQLIPALPEQPFQLQSVPANRARWMYPFNGDPGGRPTASVFGSLGSGPTFDSRDAQFLLGWSTANRIPAGRGTNNYFIRRARVTLTISSANYIYTPALRDYRTYFPTNDPRHLAAATISSPVELFGAGYRGEYTAATYPPDGPFYAQPPSPGVFSTNRVAYAAGFDASGKLVDVSNHVGDDGTNELSGPFEVAPFAVGQTTNALPEQPIPVGGKLTFDLNLDDPLIYAYVQRGLDEGNLHFIASSLIPASRTGPVSYPNFYTIFSQIANPDQFPLLDLEGEIVRSQVDGDADGLPDDWENFYFGSLGNVATTDLDADGMGNLGEYFSGTNPNAKVSALRILSIQQAANAITLHFTFAPGRQYSISWSDDLHSWHLVANPTLFYSSDWLAKTVASPTYPALVYAGWRDQGATDPQRYYRIRVQP